MELIRKTAYARAGLVGNPSDGYNGKTISVIVNDFSARVTMYEWDQLEIVWSQEDRSRFRSVRELAQDVRLHGYYGGIRLVKAAIKKFVEYCISRGHRLHDRNFSVRYESDVPRQVGLAGSSAIIVATLRCLMEFYNVEIPLEVQPSLVLSVESEELGIAAGLQDRVIQIYEGVVSMDFAKDRMQQHRGLLCGVYERLDPALLPPLYIAYSTGISEPTEVFHNNLRSRFEQGEPAIVAAMTRFAELASEAHGAILNQDATALAHLIDENFDLRRSICRLPQSQIDIVERARSAGASAKFAGSGGAIIGTYPNDEAYDRIVANLAPIDCKVIRLNLACLTNAERMADRKPLPS